MRTTLARAPPHEAESASASRAEIAEIADGFFLPPPFAVQGSRFNEMRLEVEF